jgi:hypothetical protein
MFAWRRTVAGLALAALSFAAPGTQGQFVSASGANRSALKPEVVTYQFPEQVSLSAGKASLVALHFRIAPGLHINSHTPSADYLIATTFSIPAGESAQLEHASYPVGKNITLPADPKMQLNVYTGDFAIDARLVAARGNHLVQGKLRYQACDQVQCMPPKTITVPIDVIGK